MTSSFFFRTLIFQGTLFVLLSVVIAFASPSYAQNQSEGFSYALNEDISVGLKGYVQLDSRTFVGKHQTGEDEFLVRRLRPQLTLKADDFSLKVTPNLLDDKAEMYDLYGAYNFTPQMKVEFGKMKPPIALEKSQAASDLFFIERGHTGNFSPSRDGGVLVSYNTPDNSLVTQIGVFQGAVDNVVNDNNLDNKPAVTARVFTTPFLESTSPYSGIGFGVGGSWGIQQGDTVDNLLPSYKTTGQQPFFKYSKAVVADGSNVRLFPHAYWFFDNAGIVAEYALESQKVRDLNTPSLSDTLVHQAWQTSVNYVLTGEKARFDGIKPDSEFNPFKNTWGAWEVSARVGQTFLDNDSPVYSQAGYTTTTATGFGVGLNWYVNSHAKFVTGFDQTHFNGNKEIERAWFTRLQVNL